MLRTKAIVYHTIQHWKSGLISPIYLFLGITLGMIVLYVGDLNYKWIFMVVALGCLPLFVIVVGSLRKALVALLIFSLSMNIDVTPWYSDRFNQLNLGVPISLTALLLITLFTMSLVKIFFNTSMMLRFPRLAIPLGVIVLWSGMSIVVASEPRWVIYEFTNSLVAFFLFIYASNLVKSDEDIRFILKCVAITVAFTGAIGICQYFIGDSLNLQFLGGREALSQVNYRGSAVTRVSGFLGHSNNLAYYLVGFLPLIYTFSLRPDNRYANLLPMISFVLGLSALVLTFSRGGWVAFILAMLMIVVALAWRSRLKSRFKRRVAFVSIFFIIVIALLPFSGEVYSRLVKDDYGAALSRVELVKTSLVIIKKHPMTGIGLGNYRYVVSDYDTNPGINEFGIPEPVHNVYLHTAAELGVPTLLLFLYVLIVSIWQGMRASRSKDSNVSLFALGLTVGLIGLCIHGMVELGTLGHPKLLSIFFLAGLLTGLGSVSKIAVKN